MIGVALDMDHLRGHILGAVANGVNDGAAADRAVRAGGTRFAGAGNLKYAELGEGGLQIETKNGGGGASNGSQLQKVAAGWVHRKPPIREE
jgi:hypothetical protein